MIKKKSRTLAFVLAASLIMPTIEGTVLAATNEEKTIIQESNINTDSLNQSTETSEESIFESGDGSQENPFTINTLEQLKAFRDSVNNGNNYQGKFIKLTSSIDLSGEDWEPIGRHGIPFSGNFDGGSLEGIIVNNLKVEKEINEEKNPAKDCYAGFFGNLNNGKIENLTINNANVTGDLYVSPVVGMGYIGKISNIKVIGNVKVKGQSYVGGIKGNGYATVDNCHIDTEDDSYIKGVLNGSNYIGGIVGFNGEGNIIISDCSIKNIEIGGADRLGGISGNAHYGNTIKNCSVKNTIIRQDQTNENADTLGTIAGANQACSSGNVKILDCVVKNTYAYIRDSNEPITQKISMLDNDGNDVKTNVIVGDNVKE